MSFIVRGVREEDYEDVFALAKQFTLLNLPAEPKVLKKKIQTSIQSFAGKLEKDDAEYVFVLEDLEVKRVVGTCLILAKHGNEKYPHYFFKIIEKKRFSPQLGVGFIHSVLRLGQDANGPSEIGGLLLDRGYRSRPEKLGRLLSLSRFIYMGMFPERFQKEILCELSPPLTDEGRSEFWEALGRRFTGMTYQEADRLSQLHKDFIRTLFPEEDIYLSLLDSRVRLVMGEVGDETRPARYLLEKIGFKYRQEVDPFDGGPHYSAPLVEVTVVKNGQWLTVGSGHHKLKDETMIGYEDNGLFYCAKTLAAVEDGKIQVNFTGEQHLKQFVGKKAFCSKM